MDSDAKFIILEKIRSNINLLKKSNVSNELVVNGKTVLSVLKELQSFVRYGELGHLDLKALLLPFLHILGSRTISGPYVRCAIDALQAFLLGDVFAGHHAAAVSEALRQIALTLISCKFIHTDIAGDELVQLQLIETLRHLLVCPAALCLSDSTQWSILEFCCLTMAKTGGQSGTMLLYQAAERTVYAGVEYMLTSFAAEPAVADDGYVYSTGAPGMCRLLEYCVRVLSDAAGAGAKSDSTTVGAPRSSTPPIHHRSTSGGSATPLPLNEASCDRTTLHVLFVLRLIKSMFTNAAQAPIVSQLLVRSKDFARLVGDEMGFALLLLSGGSAGAAVAASVAAGSSTPGRGGGAGAQLGQQLLTSAGGPVVLTAVLGLFEALLHVAGPALRILVEGFARQVYLRSLMQTYSLFVDQIQFLGEGVELVSPMVRIAGKGSGSATLSNHAEGGFRLDELEVILESFADLLSTPSLLASWFASFDCDPVSADLVQPIVEYASRCACLAWTFSSEFSGGYFKDIAALVVQLFRHIGKTLHARCDNRKHAPAVSGSGAERATSISAPVAGHSVERLTSIASLMKASRGAKHVFAAAAALFVEKPEKGLRYLQERGSLPTPLTPEAVAAFLRLAPDLPKETAGAFLGELGKDDPTAYEGNTQEFHRQVLLRYVESFEFANQSVLDCMRIFLSAFRLPGEAQQIDRILVAFSEHCYAQCLEGRQGSLENAEVTYILTFSIIMLNTDRHNPNIKSERKMTLEQFIRNNTNYGKDSKQTIPLTKEFLTSIFLSIDEFPIRTEGKALAAVATSEVWKDSQMQARADPRRGVLVCTQRHSTLVHTMLSTSATVVTDREVLDSILREVSPAEVAHGIVTPASIVRRLLMSRSRTSSVVAPQLLSLEVAGHHALFDEDLLSCVWLDLLRGCLCVHVHNAVVMQRVLEAELERDPSYTTDPGLERGPTVMKQSLLRKLVGSSNALLNDFLQVATAHKLGYVLDCANLLMLMCSGMVKGHMAEKLLDFVSWDKAPTTVTTAPITLTMVDSAILLYQFRHFESARLAASTLLSIIQHNQGAITQWSLVWCFLGALRDCAILPREMVLDPDADLLPPNIREEFELVLLDLDRRVFDQHRPVAPKRVRRQSTSLLSLQGLGEALFGGSSVETEEAGEESPNDGSSSSDSAGAYVAEVTAYRQLFKLDALSARWDGGYEDADSPRRGKGGAGAGAGAGAQENMHTPPTSASAQKLRERSQSDARKSNGATVPAFSIVDGGATLDDLRALVASSGVAQLISDSRFLSEASLDAVLRSLVCVTECKDEAQRALAEFAEAALAVVADAPVQPKVSTERWAADTFLSDCHTALQGRHSFSSASVAWLEMVLVEVSLRNRDRFQSLWPVLKHHYVRVLCGSAASLSYVTERRVLGILKICTRMISRDHFSGTILELLGRIFARTNNNTEHEGHSHKSPLAATGARSPASPAVDDDEEGGYTLAKPHFPPMSAHLLQQLSNQIAASMWRVLTLNVDILPMLPLEQWQTLFTIIALSAAAGGFASIKSFESMAWLLHEPRLVAKVPVFCIIGVKPLLKNPLAPLSVSVGAVHLLTHLHGRLEVLIREDKEDYVDCELDETSLDGDTPILWESCWTPILRALGEGIADTRAPVREACAEALCQAILDRHSHAVPAGVLVDILGGIIAPMIVQLRDHLVDEVNRSLPAGMDRLLTSKEAAALSQQQWVNVEADPALPVPPPAGTAAQEHRPDTLRVGTVSVLMECLSALCRSFLQHLRKLAAYPSFDKLWLCILTVLGHFLDSNLHGAGELATVHKFWDQLKEGTKLLVQDLGAMCDSSRDHLLRMLRALRQEKVFETRPGLLSVTRDMIRHFDDHSEPLNELQAL